MTNNDCVLRSCYIGCDSLYTTIENLLFMLRILTTTDTKTSSNMRI